MTGISSSTVDSIGEQCTLIGGPLSLIYKLENDINLSKKILSSSEKYDCRLNLINKSVFISEQYDDESQSNFYKKIQYGCVIPINSGMR